MARIASGLLPVYRVPLRSQKPGVDHTAQVECCLRKGIVGIGWGLTNTRPRSLDATLRGIERKWNRRSARTVARLADAPAGSLVWSRHTDGTYLLGKITGPWRPSYTRQAEALDLHQVRKTVWQRPLLDVEVAGSVIRRFAGRGQTFSEMRSDAARIFSHRLWAELAGEELDLPAPSREEVLCDHLDPLDVEDLVYVYLQVVHDYVVLPASRRTDTPTYEYALVRPSDGQLAVVQVKTGDAAVDVGLLARTAGNDHAAYAYATSGRYAGGDHGRVKRISDAELMEFVASSPTLLPPRVKRWFDYAADR